MKTLVFLPKMAEFTGVDWCLCSHLPNAVFGTHRAACWVFTDVSFPNAFVGEREALRKAWGTGYDLGVFSHGRFQQNILTPHGNHGEETWRTQIPGLGLAVQVSIPVTQFPHV